MPKMQLITGKIALSGADQTVIHRDQFDPLSPAEVMVLNLEHGPGACEDLACIGYVDRSVEEEVERLHTRGYREEHMEKALPGVGHRQDVPMELPGLQMVAPRPVPEPDITGQKVIIANKIMEMGGTPPPANFPLAKFNTILADLMVEAGLAEKPVEQPFDVGEVAMERVEKRILARQIEAAGGEAPDMAEDIEVFMDALMDAQASAAPPLAGSDTMTATETEKGVDEIETPKQERARLKAEIARLGGKAPPNFAKVEVFRAAFEAAAAQGKAA